MKLYKRKWLVIPVTLLLAFGVLQFLRPEIPVSDEKVTMQGVPEKVTVILDNSCFACHSNTDKLSWFDKITPANFLVADHIKEGREALNFSDWEKLTSSQQQAKLYYSLNKILEKEMPLPGYVALHNEAAVSDKDILTLKEYLSGLTPRKPWDSIAATKSKNQYENRQYKEGHAKTDTVEPAPNGITYIDDYRNWKAISTTDRFDNGTMRVIFANDVAVKAIEKNEINPWPDGSVFAKVAWKEETDKDGNIQTGEFYQVEFMIKNSNKYAGTKGWGWARWRGMDLKPYGEDASFVDECIRCHQPFKENDYVFTLPLKLNLK